MPTLGQDPEPERGEAGDMNSVREESALGGVGGAVAPTKLTLEDMFYKDFLYKYGEGRQEKNMFGALKFFIAFSEKTSKFSRRRPGFGLGSASPLVPQVVLVTRLSYRVPLLGQKQDKRLTRVAGAPRKVNKSFTHIWPCQRPQAPRIPALRSWS